MAEWIGDGKMLKDARIRDGGYLKCSRKHSKFLKLQHSNSKFVLKIRFEGQKEVKVEIFM